MQTIVFFSASATSVDTKTAGVVVENGADSKLEFYFLGMHLPTPASMPTKRLRRISFDLKNNVMVETIIDQGGIRTNEYSRSKEKNNVYQNLKGPEQLLQEFVFSNLDLSNPSAIKNLGWIYSVSRLGRKLKSIESKLENKILSEQHLPDSLVNRGVNTPPTLMTQISKELFEVEREVVAATPRAEYSGKVLLNFVGQNRQSIEYKTAANFMRNGPNLIFNLHIDGYIYETFQFTRSLSKSDTYFISSFNPNLGSAFWSYDLFVESGIAIQLPRGANNSQEFLIKIKLAKGTGYSGKISFFPDSIQGILTKDSDKGSSELPSKINFKLPRTGVLSNKKNKNDFTEDLAISSGSTNKYYFGIERAEKSGSTGDLENEKYILYRQISAPNMDRITNIFHDRDSGRVVEDFEKQKDSPFFAIRSKTGYRWLLTPGSLNDWKILGKNESTILKRDVILTGDRYVENKTKLSLSTNQVLEKRVMTLLEISKQEYLESLDGYSRNGTPRYFIGTTGSEPEKKMPSIASVQQAPGYGLVRIYIAFENEVLLFLLTQKSDPSSWFLEGPIGDATGVATIITGPKNNAPGESIFDHSVNFDLKSLHFSFVSKNKGAQFKGQFKLDKNDLYFELSKSIADKSNPTVYKMTLKNEKFNAWLQAQKALREKLIAPAAKPVEKTKPLDPKKPNAKK